MKFSLAVAATLAAAVQAQTYFVTNYHYVTVDAEGNIVGTSVDYASASSDSVATSVVYAQAAADDDSESSEIATQAFVTSSLEKSVAATSVTSAQQTTLSTSTTSSSSSSSASSGFDAEILEIHNEKRALHSADDLTWSSTLASYAQDLADAYTCGSTLTHSGGSYGENLAYGYSSADLTVEAWYSEGDDYDYSSATVLDHFTQIIWKSTKQLGCAKKTCGSGLYVVCEYYPAGNVVGEGTLNLSEN